MPFRRRSERPVGGGPHAWIIDVRVGGKRFRKTVEGNLRRKDVAALEREWIAELEEGLASTRRAPTVRAVFARYWDEHGRHLASWRSERGYLDRWADVLGDHTTMASITVNDITAALASWRGHVSDSTINRRLSFLQRVWLRAEDLWKMKLPHVPWRRLKLAEPDFGDQSIRREHREAFIAALPRRTALLFRFGLATGLRRGGMLRIEAQHIDRENGIIHTWSKGRAGGKHTPIIITDAVALLLDEIGVPDVGRLFAVTQQQVRLDIEKAQRATGLDVTLRRTRHSFAQDLEDAGEGDAITAALHHSDPKLRRRYSKVRMAKLKEALERAQRKLAR